MYALESIDKKQRKIPGLLLESVIVKSVSFHNTSNQAICGRVNQEDGYIAVFLRGKIFFLFPFSFLNMPIIFRSILSIRSRAGSLLQPCKLPRLLQPLLTVLASLGDVYSPGSQSMSASSDNLSVSAWPL